MNFRNSTEANVNIVNNLKIFKNKLGLMFGFKYYLKTIFILAGKRTS